MEGWGVSGHYDRHGNPIEMMDWAARLADDDYKRVAIDKLPDGDVSTVWLGLDHRFGAGPPLIFETLVFGGPLDGEMQRYSTEQDAQAGHREMVRRIRALKDGGVRGEHPSGRR